MAEIKREGEKVWLDLDPYYPPKFKQPVTDFKAIAITLKTMGSKLSYEHLMGISGTAFRFQLAEDWCPSSPHPFCGFNCGQVAWKALKLNNVSKTYQLTKKNAGPVVEEIIASIEKGIPVVAGTEETGLIVGYINDGKKNKIIVRQPYSNKGDEPDVIPLVPARINIFTGVHNMPDNQNYLDSLHLAIKLMNMENADGYKSGFAAYNYWISSLLDENQLKKLKRIGEAELSNQNAHIYYCLVDARECAAKYLAMLEKVINDRIHQHLMQTIGYYTDIVEKLQNGMQNIVWDWEFSYYV